MNLSRILGPDELRDLAGIERSSVGRAVLKLIEAERAAVIEEVTERPSVDDTVLANDFRFKLGGAQKLAWLQKQIAIAVKLENGGRRA